MVVRGVVQNIVLVLVVMGAQMGGGKKYVEKKAGEYKYVLEDKEKPREGDEYREEEKKKKHSDTEVGELTGM